MAGKGVPLYPMPGRGAPPPPLAKPRPSGGEGHDRGLTHRAPGLPDRRDQEEARFVGKDEMGAQPCGVFFTRGQPARFQAAMAASSRSTARRSGVWGLQPSLVQELAHVVAMVAHPQAAVDQLGNPLRGPDLGPVAVRHGPCAQEPHEARFLLRCEPGGSAGRRLGLQRRLAASLQRIAPPEHSAGVAPQAAGDLMQGELLLEERDHATPTLLQQFGGPAQSHGTTPFPEDFMLLHYLCGSQ